MAVLIEANSVVIRADRLLSVIGSWEAFKQQIPNRTLCADGELVRVGFMLSEDAQAYVRHLESLGLRYLENGGARDLVVVEQLNGPTSPCDWIEFMRGGLGGNSEKRVAACRLVGGRAVGISLPEGWRFEDSLSNRCGRIPTDRLDERLAFLEHIQGKDMYWDKIDSKKVYIGRAQSRLDEEQLGALATTSGTSSTAQQAPDQDKRSQFSASGSDKNKRGETVVPRNEISKAGAARAAPQSKYATANAVLGFVIGFGGAVLVEGMIVALMIAANAKPIGPGWLFFPIAAGSATARHFRGLDSARYFSAITYGMNPRLPAAIFFSWALVCITYLVLIVQDFSDWFEQNWALFCATLVIVPAVAVVILVAFRWASDRKSVV